jgi:hypothetical protein
MGNGWPSGLCQFAPAIVAVFAEEDEVGSAGTPPALVANGGGCPTAAVAGGALFGGTNVPGGVRTPCSGS